ncbi:ATP synthase subunit I [Ammoniphilus sp. CFH 90114]|uniref:ATP synthase subunit I n=1 Tax=Ammoniphilus sp. CFH 90114 TaxID=2493665 RepID=UPI00100E7AF4|nr:ATP synthase subunit I [Ammoniphilus sp. CFH 90114]RXT01123.1 ATP synthase subunit I [Ammoniphilus sp. CFH 90114]
MTDDYIFRVRRISQWTLYVLAGAILGWGFAANKTWFAGLALGLLFGLLGAVFTAWKIHRVGEIAIQYKGERKKASLGMPTRFALAILATMIATRYPEYFHVIAMVIGLMIPPVIALVDSLLLNQKNDAEEGGEL